MKNSLPALEGREVSISLRKSVEKGLGFSVKERFKKPHVVVSEINKGGPAEQNGLLRVGDVILAVNHHNLTGISYKQALKKLRGVPFNSTAILLVRGSAPTHLQLSVSQNGSNKTVRSGFESIVVKKKKITEMCVSEVSRHKLSVAERHVMNGYLKEVRSEDAMRNEVDSLKDKDSSKTRDPSYSLLKNWESLSDHRDSLHLNACPVNVCSSVRCKGSVMNPEHMTVDPRTWTRTAHETKRLARDFIDQYFKSTKRFKTAPHSRRLLDVEESIDKTGSYTLTESELIFGAKTAWRNAPRCIGRIQWNKLHVFDARHVTTTNEMFDFVCQHLKYATNKGNIRSCITFFPPRVDVSTEFRVWNPQLIRYAGYRQADGSIVGDPISVEFTQICERLGWKGKGTQFDILPLVLQANGQDPDLYEIPQDLILEVIIRHPEFPWMEKMGLKWYAVPAVSGMLLDIGGIQFPACPFNGWFMGTEVGRDLCDTSRYNMLKSIASKMNLNTNNSSSLWKDKALVEINLAIIHSFQSDRVTIMDHHVATESFMKHFENEMKLRKGCPGDWVWLVPPLSGSSTPVFHQEILNYILNPTCLYQPDPWKYYTFKKTMSPATPSQKKIKFKDLARSVMLTSSMMTKAMSKRTRATILYATETGKSKFFAEQLKEVLDCAFSSTVVAMSEYDSWMLEYESLVLVVTSTFGNGDPPENGENFAQELHKMSQGDRPVSRKKRFGSFVGKVAIKRRKSYLERVMSDEVLVGKEQGALANVKFAVFGLGSTAYPHFCAFAHAVDTLLGEMGGERLLEIGEGDELAGQEDSFKKWAKSLYKSACESFCLDDSMDAKNAFDAIQSAAYLDADHRVSVVDEETLQGEIKDLEKLHRKKLEKCRLAERLDLHERRDFRATILVKLRKENSNNLGFLPGDHIGIFPRNNPDLVEELLNAVQNSPPEDVPIQLEVLMSQKTPAGVTETWSPDLRLPPCSLRTAFSRYLDITTSPSPQLLALFAQRTTNNSDKMRLETLSEGGEEYDEWKFDSFPNLVEVLSEFPSVKVECSLLLSQLPLLQCRYYSISSSPDAHPGEIHCTVSVVLFQTEGGNGAIHRGVCSTYLDTINQNDDIICFIRRAPGFHLPGNRSSPCIFVGPGTGIAPFRSFWQHLAYENPTGNPNTAVLLFGCRSPSDHMYKEEVEEAKRKEVISHYYTAFSRMPDSPKVYVQNLMEKNIPDLVYSVLQERGGHLYVCGDVKMANDVAKAVVRIIANEGKIEIKDAEDLVNNMKVEGRYHEDIFGVTLRTKEVKKNVRLEAKQRSLIE